MRIEEKEVGGEAGIFGEVGVSLALSSRLFIPPKPIVVSPSSWISTSLTFTPASRSLVN
jgi:hypothetical protein